MSNYFIPGRGITNKIVNAKPVRVMVMPAGRFNDGFNAVRKAAPMVEYRELGVDMPAVRYTHHSLPKLMRPEAAPLADNDNPQEADFTPEDIGHGFSKNWLMEVIRKYDAVIMANAVRGARKLDQDYQDLLNGGNERVCAMYPSHNEKAGPFGTRVAADLMGLRGGGRTEALFEDEFETVELDGMPSDGDFDPIESMGAEDEGFVTEPEFEGDVHSEPELVNKGEVLEISETRWIQSWISKVEGMEPLACLALIMDLCLPNLKDLTGELAEKEPAKRPWNRELTVPEYADDEDSVDVFGVNDDEDEYVSASSRASEGQPFEDEDFFDLADIEADRYCEAIGFGRFTHGGHSLHKPYVIVNAMDIGTDLAGDREPIENGSELDAELDKLLPHLPTSSRMASKMSTFVASLEDHKESHLSKFYQAGVIQACLQGYGWKQAIEVGKESHRIGVGLARLQTSQTMYSKKVEAPQGAPTFQQVAVKAATHPVDVQELLLSMVNSTRPSAGSIKKGLAATGKVEILKKLVLDRHVAVWAKVESSNHGTYNTKALFHMSPDGKRHIDGVECTCPAHGECYHGVEAIKAATR